MCEITASPRQTPRPKWRWLHALLAAALALFAVVEIVLPAGAWRTLTQCIAVVVSFGLMAAWVRRNRVALALANLCACAEEQVTGRVVHSHPVAPQPVQPAERVPVRFQHAGLPQMDAVVEEVAACVSTSDQP